MKIILLQDVPKLGRKFDIKEVSNGYAQNLLLPKGLAMIATKDTIKRVEQEKSKINTEKKIQDDLLLKNLKNLEGVTITIIGKVNDKDHLFAGIHKEVIVSELKKQAHIDIDPSNIDMEHPLKIAGIHEINIKAKDKVLKFKVEIKGE